MSNLDFSALGDDLRNLLRFVYADTDGRNLFTSQVEPKEAWRAVVGNRWKTIGPSCFDA
jgi:hypothetical protein